MDRIIVCHAVTTPLLSRLATTINNVVRTVQHVRIIQSFPGIARNPHLQRESWSQKKDRVRDHCTFDSNVWLTMGCLTMKTVVQLDHIYEQLGGSLSRLTRLLCWRIFYTRVWKPNLHCRGITRQVDPKKMQTGKSAAA
jgi:hypothetical protein